MILQFLFTPESHILGEHVCSHQFWSKLDFSLCGSILRRKTGSRQPPEPSLSAVHNFDFFYVPVGAAAAKFDITATNGAYLVCRKRILITFWKSRIVHRFSSIPVDFHALSCMLMHVHAFSCMFMHAHASSCMRMHAHACSGVPRHSYIFPFISMLMHPHGFSCIPMHPCAFPIILMHSHAYSCILMHSHPFSCILMYSHAFSCIHSNLIAFSCICRHSHVSRVFQCIILFP